MSLHEPSLRQEKGICRRTFLHTGAALALGTGGALSTTPVEAGSDPKDVEWRNRQAGMAYRRLGRTGMMISEVVCGGDPITLDNYRHLELALEMGLNYLDMAPAYNKGDTEKAYGKLLAASPGRRHKVFLTTKVSDFNKVRQHRYREVFDGLPADKQKVILERAHELRRQRAVEKPGYYLTYFPGQQQMFEPAYLVAAMMPDYRHRVEGSADFRKVIRDSLEGSLRRVGADHFDLLMCPHGANSGEDLHCPEIVETFQELKKQGKVRFLGVTSHNDPAGVLRAAADAGHYDAVMMAYNVVNGGYVHDAIGHAATREVGIIAMKVAHAVATHHKQLQPIPQWRIDMVERIVPGDLKAPLKAYLWALQNPHIAAVISNLWNETYVRENLGLAGKKVELRPA